MEQDRRLHPHVPGRTSGRGTYFYKFIYTGREEREYLFENGKASPDDGSGYG
jgi:hypothetical protein